MPESHTAVCEVQPVIGVSLMVEEVVEAEKEPARQAQHERSAEAVACALK